MYGETEDEVLKNAKEHGIKEHGYTEESWKRYYQRTLNISRR
jgi:predicted small metal-binding protein